MDVILKYIYNRIDKMSMCSIYFMYEVLYLYFYSKNFFIFVEVERKITIKRPRQGFKKKLHFKDNTIITFLLLFYSLLTELEGLR